ncbi:MAG: serine hydrolase [Betaproteobacteria bacterium]|nr:serine hydrolase [Betaproteobacteria bacterium]
MAGQGWIRRGFYIAGALLLGAALMAIAALMAMDIPRGAAGMAAKGICSAAFVAGRPPQTLLADEVLPASPVLQLISVSVDEASRSVTARFAGLFSRRAVLLPQRGCVLDLPPSTEPAMLSRRDAPNAGQPWPQGEAPLPPAEWGNAIDAAALQRAVEDAFIGAGNPAAANARGVAVIHRGRLLMLRTAPGFAAATPLHGWSMTKTVAAMLADKRAAETDLSFDTPVVNAFPKAREPSWVAGWREDARKQIAVADLLYMRDGLANIESYKPGGEVPRMLWGTPDVADFSAASPAEAAAGTRWRYLSASANLLSAVVRGRFASDAEYWAYPAKALFEPIGATTAVLETDTAGNWVGSSYLWASTGDWARLGLLMLNDGRWGDTQVLPPGWLERASTPAATQGAGRGYGAQTWRIGDPDEGDCKGRGLPADTIAMRGHWGQLVAIVPSREAVIVRLGWTFKKEQFDGCGFVANVLKALPQ